MILIYCLIRIKSNSVMISNLSIGLMESNEGKKDEALILNYQSAFLVRMYTVLATCLLLCCLIIWGVFFVKHI